jgi:molybdopterin converting factor small subunit
MKILTSLDEAASVIQSAWRKYPKAETIEATVRSLLDEYSAKSEPAEEEEEKLPENILDELELEDDPLQEYRE